MEKDAKNEGLVDEIDLLADLNGVLGRSRLLENSSAEI